MSSHKYKHYLMATLICASATVYVFIVVAASVVSVLSAMGIHIPFGGAA